MLRPLLTIALGGTLLLGVAAPLAVTAVAGIAMPERAGGGLISRDGTVIGAALIGQDFSGDRYFHPRPSATSEADPDKPGTTRARPYNAAASAASQQGPTSAALLETITAQIAAGASAADAATASGSGLDPHISPANARAQLGRVVLARKLPPGSVAAAVAANTEGREFGVLGEPRINVLRLNLALDALK
jgi:K+-transporting ATPase ATPase C chain